MSQEIVFTSSERGLRAGSTGFCTVRSTVGMPQNLASLLEQLTGYTHPYDAYDRSLFDKHPVNFAHYISRVGGQRFHILCRICNAPLDHTNRSNKLAHLIAFEEGEIDLSHTQGPAAAIHWMLPPAGKMQQAGDSRYWITSWPSDREPCVLSDSNRLVLPSVNDKPGPCTVWKQVLGDSGWAAVLAESVQDRKRQSVPVVFSSDQKDKCLDLVQEALSLLPPAERWGVTFSTFQSGSLPTKVECRWQFLLDSTDLAQKAIRNQHRTPVIDLTSLKGMQSPASELAAFTNSGKRPWNKASVSLSRPSAPKQPAAVPPKLSAASTHSVDDHDEDLDSMPGGYSLRAPDSRPSPRPGRVEPVRRNRKRPPSRRQIAVAGTIIVLGGIAVWAYPHFRTKQNDAITSVMETADTNNHQPAGAVKQPDSASSQKAVASSDSIKSSQVHSTAQQNLPTDTESTSKQPTICPPLASHNTPPTTSEKESSATPEKESTRTPKPFDDLRAKSNLSNNEIATIITNAGNSATRLHLAELQVDTPSDCEITLVQTDALLESGFEFSISPTTTGVQNWTVNSKQKGGSSAKKPIGTFTLEGTEFTFKFDKHTLRTTADLFRETAIRVSHKNDQDEEPVLVRLGVPSTKPPLSLSKSHSLASVTLLSRNLIGSAKEQFILACRIDGLPEGYVNDNEFKIKLDETKKFERKKKFGKDEFDFLGLEVSLIELPDKNIAVQCKQTIQYAEVGFQIYDLTVQKQVVEIFNARKFVTNCNKAKSNKDKAERVVSGAEAERNNASAKLKSTDEAKKKEKQEAENAFKEAERKLTGAKEALEFAKGWINWSEEFQQQRGVMIESVKVHYELRRSSSVQEEGKEQAILVQTEGFE